MEKHFVNSIGMKFVYIHPGKFMMGSMESSNFIEDEDMTLHEVEITQGFYMQTTQVTVKQWKMFIVSTFYECDTYFFKRGCSDLATPDIIQNDNHPVVCITWNNTQAFISWLCKKENKIYRLPTEAEWEYACRSGTKTLYHSGNSEDDLGRTDWYEANSGDVTHGVGEKLPNSFGLYDMHGNVCEWCQDWEGKYPHQPVVDPTGPDTGLYKICRGGSWISIPEYCTSAYRNAGNLDGYSYYTGFRLCMQLNDLDA